MLLFLRFDSHSKDSSSLGVSYIDMLLRVAASFKERQAHFTETWRKSESHSSDCKS